MCMNVKLEVHEHILCDLALVPIAAEADPGALADLCD